jgi:hypothetical protein
MGLTAVIAGVMTMSSLSGSEWETENAATERRAFSAEGFMAMFALTASIVISAIAG